MAARLDLKYSYSDMKPLVKWYGGLEKQLDDIRELMPRNYERYYEPFLGGGAVYFSVEGHSCLVNDKCRDLMNIYKYMRKESRQFRILFKMMAKAWSKMDAFQYRILDELSDITERNRRGCYKDFTDLVDDVKSQVDRISYGEVFPYVIPDPEDFKMEMRHNMIQEVLRMESLVDLDDEDVGLNILVSLKQSVYSFITEVLNNKAVGAEVKSAALAFILNYSADVPYKKDECGEYRLPFGGKKLCRKLLSEQCQMLESEELQAHFAKTVFECMDAVDFLRKYEPAVEDFVLLDPPDELKRGAKAWDYSPEAHKRLAKYLLEECDAKWILLLRPNASSLPLYKSAGVRIMSQDGFDKLIVKNY